MLDVAASLLAFRIFSVADAISSHAATASTTCYLAHRCSQLGCHVLGRSMRFTLRALSLRHRLFVLAAAGILPLAIFAALAGIELVAERRHEAERSALELSRAIASAVRGELRSTLAVLDGLALAADLDDGSAAAFERSARRGMADHPNWRAVVLTDAAGKVLNRPAAAGKSPRVVDTASLETALRTLKPAVGNLMAGPGGQYAVAVRVPIIRDGRLRYVASVAIKPDGILNILSMQKVPPNWVVSVIDANGIIVARSRGHNQALGRSPSPSLRALLARSEREGFEMTQTLEGRTAYTGISRLRDSGWAVAVGIPAEEVESAGARALGVYGAGIAISLIVSALLAMIVARGITEPVARLRQAAGAFGRGEASAPLGSGIAEIDDVGEALREAAAERTRIEQEKELLRLAEHEALQRAQKAALAKDEFLAMLGHELRNPLAPILTTLELLRLRNDKQIEPQLQILKRQVNHMTRLVDDLLDVSRITAGRIELEMVPVELNGIVERALEAVAPLTDRRKRQVASQLAEAHVWVAGDAVRLVQVVTNLLTNALKFTPPDRAVSLAVARHDDKVILSVVDEGMGIAAELLPNIFESFTQGQQELARRSGGLGLGLSIVHNLVQRHGGTVSAHSAGPGMGSQFTVTLPVIHHEAATGDMAEDASASPAARAAADILVVDDNVDAAEAIAVGLGLAGYSVRCAHDAESALREFATRVPDLAIFDIGLPTLSGYELAEEVRRNRAWSACSLVALTGYGQQADRNLATQAGFAAHLTKPVELGKLEQVLATLLGQAS